MKKLYLSHLSVFVLVSFQLLIWGCGTNGTNSPLPPPVIVSLSVTPASSSIAPGTTAQYMATGKFSDNSFRNLTTAVIWSSSDTSIATVSNTAGSIGFVTSTMNTGSTTISATTANFTGSAILNVSPLVSIAVTPPTPPSLAPGTTQQFNAIGTLANNAEQNLSKSVNWSSSNTSIATISNLTNSSGLATVVSAPGTSTIGASFGLVSGTTILTSSQVASIAISPSVQSIPKGTTQKFNALGTLADSTSQNLTSWAIWSSSSTGIATIGNGPGVYGLASAISEGSTNISASFSGVLSNLASLTVTAAVVNAITLTPKNQSIALGKTEQLDAMGTFSDRSTQDITSLVTWNLSNSMIGTISNVAPSYGLFSSLSQGTTEITAKLSGISSNSATFTVTPAQLVSISITPISSSIFVGGTQQYTATGTFTDGSTQDLTTSVVWASSNSVAVISNTALSQGLATSNSATTGSTFITATLSGITSNQAILMVHF